MKQVFLRTILAGSLLTCTLTACGVKDMTPQQAQPAAPTAQADTLDASAETSRPPKGNKPELVIALPKDISGLNPMTSSDQINDNCLRLTHETLFRKGMDGSVMSYIATEGVWTSDTTYELMLRQDVTFSDGTKMTAELEWVSSPASAATFCGAATNGTALFTLYRGTSDFHRMGYASGSRTLGGANVAPTAGVRYRVTTMLDDSSQSITVVRKSDGAWVPVGSGTRTEADAGPMDTGLPLYLFARNLNGAPDEYAQVRIYSLKLWQKNGQGDYVLVRDIKPAYSPGDNAPALFDRLNGVWYFNNGKYGFAAGGETKQFVGRAMVIFVR